VTTVRLLTPSDLDGALALSTTAGWNQQHEDWRMLLSLAPQGSFAAISDGGIVGTAIGIDYDRFSWIAMMLVDPVHRGKGLGRRLLQAAMDAVPADRPIRLDATPLGRPLYQSHGFEDEAVLNRHVADAATRRMPTADDTIAVRPLTIADLAEVTGHDAHVFGGHRRGVFEWALARAPQYARVAEHRRGRPHYCFGRQGRLFDQIGPVVTDDDDVARALVASASSSADGRAVVVDAFDECRGFTGWLQGSGFRIERPLFRMCRPQGTDRWNVREDTSSREYAIFGPEFA
jgi:GNAT superfamily N-acetyltransferase